MGNGSSHQPRIGRDRYLTAAGNPPTAGGISCDGESTPEGGGGSRDSPRRPDLPPVPLYRFVPNLGGRLHLLSVAWARDWPRVVARCLSHPHEASDVTQTNRTALHLSMFQGCPPPTAVAALLSANAHAAIVRDCDDRAPLHYACRFGGSDREGGGDDGGGQTLSDAVGMLCVAAVEAERAALLQTDIDADRRSGSGRWQRRLNVVVSPRTPGAVALGDVGSSDSPLFLACCRNAPLETIRALVGAPSLAADNALVMRWQRDRGLAVACWVSPYTGAEPWYSCPPCASHSHSPLRVLWANYEKAGDGMLSNEFACLHLKCNEGIECFQTEYCFLETNESKSSNRLLRHVEMSSGEQSSAASLWRKITFLLCKGRHRSVQTGGNKHSATYWPSIPSASLGALCHPLHAVASLPVPIPGLVSCFLSQGPDLALQRDNLGLLPLHHAILAGGISPSDGNLDDTEAVIEKLLSARPEAAGLPDSEGVLPLALALHCKLDFSVLMLIIKAMPEVLRRKDNASKLYPFMLAANKFVAAPLGTIYQLLHLCPHVMQDA